MIKFLKYLFKKDGKTMALHILISFLLCLVYPHIFKPYSSILFISSFTSLLIFFNIFIFTRSLSIMIKDFYSNERYFIFSLPIKKFNIVLSKVIYSTIYNSLIYISALATIVFNNNTLLELLKIDTLKSGIIVILSTSITIFCFISLIYLVIVISKILFNSSKATSASIFLTISLSLVLLFNYDFYLLNGTILLHLICIITGLILCYISGYLLKEKVDL
jgi:hypothetical protein